MKHWGKKIGLGLLIGALCISNITVYAEGDNSATIEKSDFIVSGSNLEDYAIYQNNAYDYIINTMGEDAFVYFFYVEGIDESREGVIKTYRNISLGASEEQVLQAYGLAKEYPFAEDDSFIEYISEQGDIMKQLINNLCTYYISYDFDDKGQIVFCFDDSQTLNAVLYSAGLFYENMFRDSETIATVQTRLNELGYDCGTPDGIIGEKTQSAIQKYQSENGLEINGNITQDLWLALSNKTADENSVTETAQSTVVYDTYNKARNLTKDDLTLTDGQYYYEGLPLVPDDAEWVDDSLNTQHTVEHGAIYRKVCYVLQGFQKGINNGSDYSELVFGLPSASKDELKPYVENAVTFIREDDSLINIMKKFQSLNCVDGTFDFESGQFGTFDFTINNLTECANEMQISEKMLGYILDFTELYAPEITFDGNSCHFVYAG